MNWFVIYTKARAEESVCRLLANAGFETLNPKIKTNRFVRKKFLYVVDQLFPCYIFVRFDIAKYAHMIHYTRGVKYIVGKENPIVVHPEIINAIKERMDGDIVVVTPEKFSKGDRVLIREGPFKDFYGIFERDVTGRERAMILLEALHCKIDIESGSLKKA